MRDRFVLITKIIKLKYIFGAHVLCFWMIEFILIQKDDNL